MADWLQLPAGLQAELVNHVWQSTVFAIGAWLLTLALRQNHAHVRYRIWMLASLKFLLPFSLLLSLGGHLNLLLAKPAHLTAYTWATDDLATPYKAASTASKLGASYALSGGSATVTANSAMPHVPWLQAILIVLWLCVTIFLLSRWAWAWWQLRRIVGMSRQAGFIGGVPILETGASADAVSVNVLSAQAKKLEPGVFGILRPVLLLPEGIRGRLTSAQMQTILAHELCHVRRRDNLTAAMHMVVETLFWFHPAVWWIRARLVDERERACDEAVLASSREPQAYAEGILNVCKFYMGAPVSIVSGVTGSNLKLRIARIMTEQVGRRLDLGRIALLSIAGLLAVGVPVSFGLVHAAAQTAEATGIVDTWQGTLHAGDQNLRTVLKVSKDDKGALTGTMYSIDQGGQPIATSAISFEGGTLKYAIERIDLIFEGKLSADGKSIVGTMTQGKPLPMVFERTTPATAWAIPEPPKPVPPMAADAKPDFEVATIKPAPPEEQGKLFGFRGDRVKTINTTLLDLITFAYDVQQKQVVGGPDWIGTIKWDIDGQPDTPGAPNRDQLRGMFQKLLADRFQLKFHTDKKDMAAYVLTVSKTGSKMKPSTDDGRGLPSLFFRGLGVLTVANATMGDFAGLMQVAVLDRPVVDQTGLTGKYDFLLKWTPDESQFGGMGIKVPPPSDAADAPAPLFTALPEQTGLKLDAGKAEVKVLVTDKAEKPSAN